MSIGSTLQQAREAARLSLLDVSNQTRMRQTMVSAIERDDFTLCGGDVYARGHIRSIARAVGIDAEPLIAEYDQIHGNPNASVIDLIDSSPIMVKPRRNPWQPAMAVAGLALFVIAGVAIAQGDSNNSPIAEPTNTTSPSVPNNEPTTPTSPSDDAIADAGDGVTFNVVASAGSSWLSVRDANGAQLFQGILSQGQSRTFKDDTNLKVVIGNAGGVQISVNGRDLGIAGAAGAVVRFNLLPGDPGIG